MATSIIPKKSGGTPEFITRTIRARGDVLRNGTVRLDTSIGVNSATAAESGGELVAITLNVAISGYKLVGIKSMCGLSPNSSTSTSYRYSGFAPLPPTNATGVGWLEVDDNDNIVMRWDIDARISKTTSFRLDGSGGSSSNEHYVQAIYVKI